MKISIIGYSGSGKSTLARQLAEYYQCACLHMDKVEYLPNWKKRELTEKTKIVESFLQENNSWVIDGNYSSILYQERMQEADLIIEMLFNRFVCFKRVIKRYQKYKNTTRPDVGEGCNEKVDFEFVKWIFFTGRKKTNRLRYKQVASTYPNKTIIIKNQRQLDFWKEENIK